MASTLFALDIGTRSVVGIILKEKNGSFHVADLISIDHQEQSMSVDISVKSLISNEDVNRLELAAVQQAQQELLTASPIGSSDKLNNYYYYCVGYSVLHYKLDNEIIGNPIDQTGRSASVEVIATFLPQVVVESLLAA